MNILQNVGSNYCMQVSVHEVEDQVDVTVVFSPNNVLKTYNIFVAIKLLQEDHFSKGSLRVRGVLEGIKVLFECNNLFSPFVNSLPDNTVGSFAQLL